MRLTPRLLAVCCIVASPLSAQRPPAPADSIDRWVFNQMFFRSADTSNVSTTDYGVVVLVAGTAYRLELRPEGPALPVGEITIRMRMHNSLPPLVQAPLSDPALMVGGRGFLLLPSESGEYRIDVSTEDRIQVRIVRDAHESERQDGVASNRVSRSTLTGVSVRGAWIGKFTDLAAAGSPAVNPSGGGAQLCLDMSPRVSWLGHRVQGCALAATWYFRSDTPSILAISTDPRLLLAHSSTTPYLALSLGVATTMGTGDASYSMVGPGIGYQVRVASGLLAEIEADGIWVYGLDTGRNAIAPRVVAGFQLGR